MIERLVSAITDLPVIVQGAMGSALFAALLFIGQKLSVVLGARLAKSAAKRKKQTLLDELAMLEVVAAESTEDRTHFGVVLLYRSARYLIRGLLWLTLGLIFASTISVFGIIGYLGCFYYLLQAMRVIQGIPEELDPSKRSAEIRTQLVAMQKKDSQQP